MVSSVTLFRYFLFLTEKSSLFSSKYVTNYYRFQLRGDLFFRRYLLTHAPLGYLTERAPLGGADSAPLPNSRALGRSEVG